MENFSSVQGVQILNEKTLENFFAEKIDSRFQEIETSVKALLVGLKSAGISSFAPITSTIQASGVQAYKRFEWDGGVHDFPQDFKVPRLTTSQMWLLWLFGDVNNVNIPYRFLKGDHMPQTERSQLSKAKVVMEAIREKIGLNFSDIANLGHAEAERLCNDAYLKIFSHIPTHGRMKCSNAYKHYWEMHRKPKEASNIILKNQMDN